MTARIERGFPFGAYHDLDAWGSSDLKAMRAGPPALVMWERDNPREETDATRLGTAAHCRILEPERFAEVYAHKPDGMSFATKEGKAWRAEQGPRVILSHDEWSSVEAIHDAFYAKVAAGDSLRNATDREASVLWECPVTGEALKGRPDWYDAGYVYDLKISRHAVADRLSVRAYVEGWFHQAAHYRSGLNAAGVPVHGARLVVIAPKPPHHLRTFCVEVKEATLDLCAIENERTVGRLAECRALASWPGTPETWTKVEMPPAALAASVALADLEEVE